MKRSFKSLLAAAAVLLAGSAATQSAPEARMASGTETAQRSSNSQRAPKSDSTQAPTRAVRVAARLPILPFSADSVRRFQEPRLRKVKYGHARYIWLS